MNRKFDSNNEMNNFYIVKIMKIDAKIIWKNHYNINLLPKFLFLK